MAEPWRKAKVIRIENVAPNTRCFWLQIPELDQFDFLPGQFITLDLPIHEKRNKCWRSYSIASHPNGSNVIELVIVLLEGGAGTTYLFNQVTVGFELTFRGPQGVFTMPPQLDKDLYLICTGTGVAPFRSMLHYIHEQNIPHKNIYLMFGCRLLQDCLYKEELESLEKQMPGFKYLPVFSREQKSATTIRHGYVHSVYESIIKENATVSPANFYLCGWKNMVDEAKQKITELGYTKQDVHLELYG